MGAAGRCGVYGSRPAPGDWWPPLAGVCVCVASVVIICHICPSLLCSLWWYQGMCHTGSNVTQGRKLCRPGVWEHGRQTRAGPGKLRGLWARNDNNLSPWRNAGNIWARIEFLSLFVISGLKLTDCSSLSGPLRVSPEYHCQSAAACFPYLSKSGQKYLSLNICQTADPGCDKRVQCPAMGDYFILTTGGGARAAVTNCDHTSGGDDPGGDHWPTFTILSRYRLQRLRQQQPHLSQQSLRQEDHGILMILSFPMNFFSW